MGTKEGARDENMLNALRASAAAQDEMAGMRAELREQKAEIERLRAALDRLGSMEAFEHSRAVKPGMDAELIARIEFAARAVEQKAREE